MPRNSNIRLIILLLSITFCRIQAQTTVGGNEWDIYEALDKLWLNITQFNSGARPQEDSSVTYIKDLPEIFRYYRMDIKEISRNEIRLKAELPLYLKFISTRLNYTVFTDSGKISGVKPFTDSKMTGNRFIYDDSVDVQIEGAYEPEANLKTIIDDRLLFYRTLSLPELFRPAGKFDLRNITLFYHSRSSDSLVISSEADYEALLTYIARDFINYAGLIDINCAEKSAVCKYFIILTKENAKGHHFFIVQEEYGSDDSSFRLNSISVDFYPFIRMDNISNLLGNYKDTGGSDKIPIKITR